MADAKKLIPFILKWEGGFANHPNDKGGATNKGITIATFRQYMGQDATVEQLKAMTDEQWETIFKKGFWFPFKGDYITNQSIANICVDWAWGSGTRTAIKNANSKKLFEKIKSARLAFVEAIVRRDPTQKVFLKGWRNRINSITYNV